MVIRNYTRWSAQPDGVLVADLLGVRDQITANPATGMVTFGDQEHGPDMARMIGVRLIEAAAMADAWRAVRDCPSDLTSAPLTVAADRPLT